MAEEEVELWLWEGGSEDQLLELQSGCHIVLGKGVAEEGKRSEKEREKGSR